MTAVSGHAADPGKGFWRGCPRVAGSASPRDYAGVVAPGGHRGHVVEGLAFDLLARRARTAPGLPGGHPLEPFLERLELAALVGAVAAVPAGLDRHAAAFTGGRGRHEPSPWEGPGAPGPAEWTSARSAPRSPVTWSAGSRESAQASRSVLSTSRW